MIRLIEVTDITEEMSKEFNLSDGDKLYGCYLDGTIIGYSVIRNNEADKVYLVILDEYQNQGNGSKVFKTLLMLIDKRIECVVPLDNYKMQRIVLKNNGIETGRDGENIHYVINK